MDDLIPITFLNDYIFCPISIYFHRLYGAINQFIYTGEKQLNGLQAHKTIDYPSYIDKKNILRGIEVFSEKYGLIGKIDTFDLTNRNLIERKKKIVKVYDGHVLQLYGQYYALQEMGYSVEKLTLYSMDDNKNYFVPLPSESEYYRVIFEKVVRELKTTTIDNFNQDNQEKCNNCIYNEICDRGVQ